MTKKTYTFSSVAYFFFHYLWHYLLHCINRWYLKILDRNTDLSQWNKKKNTQDSLRLDREIDSWQWFITSIRFFRRKLEPFPFFSLLWRLSRSLYLQCLCTRVALFDRRAKNRGFDHCTIAMLMLGPCNRSLLILCSKKNERHRRYSHVKVPKAFYRESEKNIAYNTVDFVVAFVSPGLHQSHYRGLNVFRLAKLIVSLVHLYTLLRYLRHMRKTFCASIFMI